MHPTRSHDRTPTTRRLALSALAAVALLLGSSAGLTAEPEALVVRVVGFASDSGKCNIALFDSKETFTRDALRAAVRSIEGLEASWRLEGLQPGDYAIALFHDENGNGKLDKKLLGLPREPYAFSNGARIRFGPPKWEKARFTYAGGDETVEIRFE